MGDIIACTGEVFRTKMGELSVRVHELTLVSKSLLPLPEKFHGLTDREARYRQRYVDLIVNPEVKDTFVKRSQILKEIRAYLDEKGFLEVDTPILTPFEIGASARPFYTHHNTLDMDMVLRIETELYLKRLIVGGMDRVYEVGRIFRNEGMDPKHNPEFTTIELYQAFTDFHGMMDLVEELYKRLALKVCGSMEITYQGKQIDLGHWERLTMVEAVKKYSGVDFNDWKPMRMPSPLLRSTMWSCPKFRPRVRSWQSSLMHLLKISSSSLLLSMIILSKSARWPSASPMTRRLLSGLSISLTAPSMATHSAS